MCLVLVYTCVDAFSLAVLLVLHNYDCMVMLSGHMVFKYRIPNESRTRIWFMPADQKAQTSCEVLLV